MLEGAATATDLIESGTVEPAGADGHLFLPPPNIPLSDGQPPRLRKCEGSANYARSAMDSLREVVELARTDPETAGWLYRFLQHGSAGPDDARRMLADAASFSLASHKTRNQTVYEY